MSATTRVRIDTGSPLDRDVLHRHIWPDNVELNMARSRGSVLAFDVVAPTVIEAIAHARRAVAFAGYNEVGVLL